MVAGDFTSPEDLAQRTGLPLDAYEGLAVAGALVSLGLGRRDGIWAAGALAESGPEHLALEAVPSPDLPAMPPIEAMRSDLWSTGISVVHPVTFVRGWLDEIGCLAISDALRLRTHGVKAKVGGVVTHRQRPGTANGVRFLNLEDETGLLNIVVLPQVWDAHYEIARKAIGVVIEGVLEHRDGVTNLVAHQFMEWATEGVETRDWVRSRDFR